LKNIIKITAFISMFTYLGLAQAADVFSDAWMKGFMAEWNKGVDTIVKPLANLDNPFTACIAYGFYADDAPKGVIKVVKGEAVAAGAYGDEKVGCDSLNWDLRAKPASWDKWIKAGKIGKWDMMKAARWGGLKFKVGNYSAMMKDPSMMGPFMKTFGLMGHVNVE
jgi:hypothetical protein